MVTQTQHQSTTNNNMLLTPEALQQMLGVVKADKDAEDELDEINGESEDKEDKKQNESINEDKGCLNGNDDKNKILSRPGAWRHFRKHAISKYLKKYDISETDVVREVKFTPVFSGLDPIMERMVVFDAYLKNITKEHFIEARPNRFVGSMIYDRLYVLLAKILFYRQAKNIQAELILLLIDLPESDDNSSFKRHSTERFLQAFQPAIASGLLRIETIFFSEEEVENIINEEDSQQQTRLFNG